MAGRGWGSFCVSESRVSLMKGMFDPSTGSLVLFGRIRKALLHPYPLEGAAMSNVYVNLTGLQNPWKSACQDSIKELNALFKKKGIKVTLIVDATKKPSITVKTDASIGSNAVHGKTSARTTGSGSLTGADVRLPPKITINTPSGIREAGAGMFEVIAAHEFVHALGDVKHSSHLMAQTMYKQMGSKPSGDKLKAGTILLPPLQLSPTSVTTLKATWK